MVLILVSSLTVAVDSNQWHPLGQNHITVNYSRYVPSILLQRTWGGSSYDSARAVAVDSLGDIYVAGWTDSFCLRCAFLLKYNSTGNLLWQRILLRNNSSPYYDSAFNAIAVDSSGNAYLSGYADSSPITEKGVLLAKFDSVGNLIWQETWGGNGSDVAQAIAIDNAGGIYVTGTTSSFSINTNQNIFVLKLRANGSLVWQEIWGDTEYGTGSGIGVDSSGSLYISGYDFNRSQYSPRDTLLLKLTSVGTLLWQERWFISDQDPYFYDTTNIASAITVDSAGNSYITGTSIYDISGLYYFGIPIIKFNLNGTIAWQREWLRIVNYCCLQSATGNSLAVDSAGNLYVTGQAGYYSSTPPTGFLMLELYSNGELEWQGTTATNGQDVGRSIALDPSRNAIAIGDIYGNPPPNLLSSNLPYLNGNFTTQSISGQIIPTNTTVSPFSAILSSSSGLETYSGQGDAYLLKLQPPTPSPPSPPLALVAQAGLNNVTVSWAPPQYTGGYPITGYNLYRGTKSGAETYLANASITHTYVDSNVKSRVTYYYYVKAVNLLGESDSSNENYATIGAPTGPTIQIDPALFIGASGLVVGATVLMVYAWRRRAPYHH